MTTYILLPVKQNRQFSIIMALLNGGVNEIPEMGRKDQNQYHT